MDQTLPNPIDGTITDDTQITVTQKAPDPKVVFDELEPDIHAGDPVDLQHHEHTGNDGTKPIKIKNLAGLILPITSLPTTAPSKFIDQFLIYDDGSAEHLYRWDNRANAYVEVGGGAHGKIYGGSASVATATWTKVDYGTMELQSGVTVDTVNKRIKVLVAGDYFIHAQVGVDTLAANNYLEIRLRVNGTERDRATGRGVSFSNLFYTYAQLSTIISLNANDYVEAWTFQQSGSSVNIGSPMSYMEIHKVN